MNANATIETRLDLVFMTCILERFSRLSVVSAFGVESRRDLPPEGGHYVPPEGGNYRKRPDLLRDLGADNLHALDRRRRREQARRLRHQRLGNRPAQVRLASRFVDERVEDTEGGRTEPERKPHGRGRLLVGEFEALLQQGGHVLLLAGFGLETNEQAEVQHV